MPSPRLGRAYVAAALLAVAPVLAAQSAGRPSARSVRVAILDAEAGKPIVDVLVSLLATPGSATLTDSVGVAILGPALAQVDTLSLRRVGFRERAITIDFAAIDTGTVTIFLARVTLLDTVISSERHWTHVEEFDARRRTGVGVFYDRTDIDRLEPASVTALVSSSRGFHSIQGSYGSRVRNARTAGGADCSLVIFINGAPVNNDAARARGANNPMTNPLTALENIPVNMVQAIELYGSSEVPSEFKRGNSGCGAVIVWLRAER